MYNNDKILLEQAYHTIYEDNNPFKPASEDDIKDRKQQQLRLANQKVQEYIKNGSVGDLDLSFTPIQSLPPSLEVGGNLYLVGSSIQSLPTGLKVDGSLDLTNTPIQSLPPDLKVDGYLNLYNTQIQSLPPDLEVDGNAYLGDTPIAKKHTIEDIQKMCPGVKGSIYE